MSTSTFITFIGFQVPLDFVWETRVSTRTKGRDCGHQSGGWVDGVNFCPSCGAAKPMLIRVETKEIRPELGIDDDDIGNGRIVSGLPDGMTVSFYDNNSGDKIMLAGEEISRLDRDHSFHDLRSAPSYGRSDIESVLIARGIPYDPNTYGVHAIVEWH